MRFLPASFTSTLVAFTAFIFVHHAEAAKTPVPLGYLKICNYGTELCLATANSGALIEVPPSDAVWWKISEHPETGHHIIQYNGYNAVQVDDFVALNDIKAGGWNIVPVDGGLSPFFLFLKNDDTLGWVSPKNPEVAVKLRPVNLHRPDLFALWNFSFE